MSSQQYDDEERLNKSRRTNAIFQKLSRSFFFNVALSESNRADERVMNTSKKTKITNDAISEVLARSVLEELRARQERNKYEPTETETETINEYYKSLTYRVIIASAITGAIGAASADFKNVKCVKTRMRIRAITAATSGVCGGLFEHLNIYSSFRKIELLRILNLDQSQLAGEAAIVLRDIDPMNELVREQDSMKRDRDRLAAFRKNAKRIESSPLSSSSSSSSSPIVTDYEDSNIENRTERTVAEQVVDENTTFGAFSRSRAHRDIFAPIDDLDESQKRERDIIIKRNLIRQREEQRRMKIREIGLERRRQAGFV